MDISVIIVNFNVKYFLEQCLLSVVAASKNIKTEIIVIDNCSSDGSVAYLKEKFLEVKFVENKKNVGFSRANNQGVKIAKGKYVLILNPDTIIAEDTLQILFDKYQSEKNLGISGVQLIDGSGHYLPESKRAIPTPKIAFNKLFSAVKKKKNSYYASFINENEIGEVPVLVGAFMFLKKSVYDEVGGFDEQYFMYGEDIDLSYKVLKAGYTNYYFGNTSVIHFKGESTQKDIKYLRYFYKAMEIFFSKYFKKNMFYNFVLRLGIKFWFLLKWFNYLFQKTKRHLVNKILFFGNDAKIKSHFHDKQLFISTEWINQFKKIETLINEKDIDTIIFDQKELSYKTIINHFKALKNNKVNFKIHSEGTNYIIGSASSMGKGEIIKF